MPGSSLHRSLLIADRERWCSSQSSNESSAASSSPPTSPNLQHLTGNTGVWARRYPAVHSPMVNTLQYFPHKFLEETRALILWFTSLILQTSAHSEAKIKDYISFNRHDLLEQRCPEKCLQRIFYMYKKKLFGKKKCNSLVREVKKAKEAQTAVPILPVLSPGEQNGPLAITAAKTLQDQV